MPVSSASGSTKGHKSQKYKNVYAFHHNKSSKKTKLILSFPINGLCGKCTRLIEWRKRYRKYKPLTVPRRCVKCGEKRVKDAYHEACHSCAAASVICAKCLLPWSPEEPEGEEEEDRSAEVEEFCRDLNAKLLLEAEVGDRKDSQSSEGESDGADSEFDSEDRVFDSEEECESEFDSSKDYQSASDEE
jgi:hypothetical protein